MIVLRTASQVYSFMKRNPDYSHSEGCGCCYSGNKTLIKGKRIIKLDWSSYAGNETGTTKVVAVIKLKRRS